MDLYWRRKCGACRLKKCQMVGMRPEYVSNREPKKREKPALPKRPEVKNVQAKKQLFRVILYTSDRIKVSSLLINNPLSSCQTNNEAKRHV
jgi:hypothetical protein